MLDPTACGPHNVVHGGADDALEVRTTQSGREVATLSVEGEIDTLTTPRLESAVAGLLTGPGDSFVVDLSGVTFLGSRGLAVLIRGAHRAGERGARLRLVTATRAVRRPLEITGSDQLFDLYTDLDAATGDAD